MLVRFREPGAVPQCRFLPPVAGRHRAGRRGRPAAALRPVADQAPRLTFTSCINAAVNGGVARAFKVDRRRNAVASKKAATMNTLTLTFNGPSSQARQALGALLQRYRSAYFVERSSNEYAVTADDATAAELARQPQWSTALAQPQR